MHHHYDGLLSGNNKPFTLLCQPIPTVTVHPAFWTGQSERKPVPVPARRHDKHTCSQRCTYITQLVSHLIHNTTTAKRKNVRPKNNKPSFLWDVQLIHIWTTCRDTFTWPFSVKLSRAAATWLSVWPLVEGTVLEMWKEMVRNGMLLFGRRGRAKEASWCSVL